MAFILRFCQGMVNGNIGVAKSYVAKITDDTNRAKVRDTTRSPAPRMIACTRTHARNCTHACNTTTEPPPNYHHHRHPTPP